MADYRLWGSKNQTQLSEKTTTTKIFTTFPSSFMKICLFGFPGGSDSKEFARSGGDLILIPGLGRSHGDGNSYPLQYSCLENSKDRGDWRVIVRGVTESATTERLTLSLHSPTIYHVPKHARCFTVSFKSHNNPLKKI